ncbi:hypothetical protein EYF80_045463 [Liparis tanakae]|uniref:Secreted protein n=1 Tax=Liparis tanakae TaxID=230148 RepID=A0A4Z2FTK4_9TELE|nr:hypothetical protein EYF80_045463 [Liparis tanakae]
MMSFPIWGLSSAVRLALVARDSTSDVLNTADSSLRERGWNRSFEWGRVEVTSRYLMTESVRLQPGMDEAFSPGEPRICSVVLMSTSVECLMENSITSEGISGVSP